MSGEAPEPMTQLQEKQARHREWHRVHRAAIVASGIPFADRGESLLFREKGKPPVDFYPSTGRWRVVGATSKTYRGGAVAFLTWFAKAKA